MQLDNLYELFLKEKTYLANTSPLTIKSKRLAYLRFTRQVGKLALADLTGERLKEFVIALRETGIADTTCNITIRELNSFLGWLHENEYTKDRLKMRQLKAEKKVLQDFTETEIKAFLDYKPKDFFEWRLHVLICTAIDTGCRINELLTLKRSNIDFDNLLIKVLGKGRRERIVPYSLELRKVLWRYSRMHQHELFFSTRKGGKLSYHNMLRELKKLGDKLGVKNERVGWHQFRYGEVV